MNDDLIAQYEERLRLDALVDYWTAMLKPVVVEKARMARGSEELALHLLTVNNVVGACEALAEAKNFRLATLVAQLPLQDEARETMKRQVEVWRERNDWSEMSDSIRAIYSVLAGDFCTVKGSGKAAEDRAAEFCIAERYGWEWKQSFALRLFYGGFMTCGDAVDAYLVDLDNGKEKIAPRPSWNVTANADNADREDVLLGLLRLLASTHANLEALLDAKNITGTYADNRLAFQLAVCFEAKSFTLPEHKFDQIVLNFAADLENASRHPDKEDTAEDCFVTAAWTLLHLRHRHSRSEALNALILRNGALIPEPSPTDKTNLFTLLSTDLSLPPSLLWRAKAQHEHASRDRNPALEALWLLRADALDDAHEVLVSTVGPDAIIEEDYADLEFLLQAFNEVFATSSAARKPEGWASGGAVYEAFLSLVGLSRKEREGRKGEVVREALGKGLVVMEQSAEAKTRGLRAKVAVVEMGRVLREDRVGRDLISHGSAGLESQPVLGLGQSAFLRYSAAMGVVV
jgi:nuclear pore complex protein Nup98-Nup96